MFIHCHDCNWGQDDFWDKNGYNPINSVNDLKENLFDDKFHKPFNGDPVMSIHLNGKPNSNWIATEFENVANRIRSMKWRTLEEFKKDPNKICPECKSENLDID